MQTCKNCKVGNFRHTTTEFVIKTRYEKRKEITIENLPIIQCKICRHIEHTEEGQLYINTFRKKVQEEMINELPIEPTILPNVEINSKYDYINPIKKTIKNFLVR